MRSTAFGRPFVQDNLSRSAYGVLRGLHLQNPSTQGKLVSVMRGRVLDVAVDVRLGSPNFGRHVAVELSEDNRRQLWVPRGFAHGFVVLSETRGFLLQMRQCLQPEGRDRGALGRSGDRHQLGHRQSVAVGARCRSALCWRRSKIFRSMDRSDAYFVDGHHGAGRRRAASAASGPRRNSRASPGRSSICRSPTRWPAGLIELKPDLIINPAAYTAVDRAEDEAELAFRINAEAPAVIARWAARHDVPLVHFSTDYVFDG